MKVQDLVQEFNTFLKDSVFEIIIYEDDGDEYVEINNKKDGGCYMDWKSYKFNKEELKRYGSEISKDQGIMNDEGDIIAKEYVELSDLILRYTV